MFLSLHDQVSAYPGGYPYEIHLTTGEDSGKRSEIHLQAPDELLFNLWYDEIIKEVSAVTLDDDDAELWWRETYSDALHYECLSKALDFLKTTNFGNVHIIFYSFYDTLSKPFA